MQELRRRLTNSRISMPAAKLRIASQTLGVLLRIMDIRRQCKFYCKSRRKV